MKPRLGCWLLLLFSFAAGAEPLAPQQAATIDASIRALLAHHPSAGLSVGVRLGDQEWTHGYGYAQLYSPELLWRPDDLKSQNLDKLLNQAISGTEAAQQTPFTALSGHSAGVRSVRFSSDGKLLVSCGNDNAICVWDVASRQEVGTLNLGQPLLPVEGQLRFTPDGTDLGREDVRVRGAKDDVRR